MLAESKRKTNIGVGLEILAYLIGSVLGAEGEGVFFFFLISLVEELWGRIFILD